MKITITGSLGHISKPLAEKLIAAGHAVTVISSSAGKEQEIKTLGATPAIGSVTDAQFLTGAFRGADAVYTMTPPNFSATNFRQYVQSVGHSYAGAIRASGVTRVVNLSSIGAHLSSGTGPVAGLHDVENILNGIEGVSVNHMRPAFFYVNFFSNIDMIKNMGIIGGNYGADKRLILVHPEDIATAIAEEIQQSFTGKTIRYVASDERTFAEIASALGAAIGKPDLKWVEFSDEQSLQGMMQAGLPREAASNYTELGTAIRSGVLFDDFRDKKPGFSGKVKLEDFATEFAGKY